MKKRILSLVLCAVMLLSMCLFMGAGVTQDAAEAAGEVPQTAVFTEAGPFRPAVSVRPQPLRAAAGRLRCSLAYCRQVKPYLPSLKPLAPPCRFPVF